MTRLSEKGLNLIKRFEGLRLKSYKCAANVDTVGYGHTGPEVVPGMTISEEQAERYLKEDLERFEQCVSSFVKLKINQNEYDALVSFSFNVGTNAFVNSTLLKKLNAGNKKSDVASEFLRWVKADGKTIPGLVRRREEEKKVFLTEPLHPMLGRSIYAKQDTWLKRLPVDSSLLEADKKLFVPKGSAWEWDEIRMYSGRKHHRVLLRDKSTEEWWFWPDHWKIINDVDESSDVKTSEIKLNVPYYSQLDNYRDAQRSCFSSSCAMLLSGIHPDAIHNDDEYLAEVFELGDTTEAWVQIAALSHFGVEAKFVQNASWGTLETKLAEGAPVPMGILHKGPKESPSGGGHWICCVGITADRKQLWVHDPYGTLDLDEGTYVSEDGEYLLYPKEKLEPRWLVEGDSSGWCVLAL